VSEQGVRGMGWYIDRGSCVKSIVGRC
jgi:hypothetical protein